MAKVFFANVYSSRKFLHFVTRYTFQPMAVNKLLWCEDSHQRQTMVSVKPQTSLPRRCFHYVMMKIPLIKDIHFTLFPRWAVLRNSRYWNHLAIIYLCLIIYSYLPTFSHLWTLFTESNIHLVIGQTIFKSIVPFRESSLL